MKSEEAAKRCPLSPVLPLIAQNPLRYNRIALRPTDGRGMKLEIRMKLNHLKTFAVATALSVTSAFAATPAIGVASAFGSFTVNSAQVSGNANVLDGSQVRTDKSSSQIYLQSGPSLTLATNTAATVYNDHLVLTQGSARVDNMSSYSVEASGYRVVPEDATSQAIVRLNSGAVEVASMSGALKVFDRDGAMLTRVGAGTASSFKPQTGASGAGSAGAGAAKGTVVSSSVLLYSAIVVGLAGVGVGAAALASSNNSSSSVGPSQNP